MPLNSETLPTDSRQEFCLALKAARERKGISLDEIEKATKIPAYMFAALERCDLRRWPNGLFRRSFFRDYVKMIGVPVTEACAAFVQLFVDEEDVVKALHHVGDGSGEVQGSSKAVQGETVAVQGSPVLPRLREAVITAWRQGSEAMTRALDRFDGLDQQEPDPRERAWVTDARRVSDAPAPRFRVRIKIQR
jgi:hypothetical protein